MSQKHTTAQQFLMLVEFMQQHEGIAKRLLNAPEYRAKSGNLWDEVTKKLNSIGPPTKNRDGWKKVWKDFKYYIKNKLRQNNKLIHGTGGGPYKQYVFSTVEEDVIRLLDLRTQESGLKVRKFGAGNNVAPNPLNENSESRSFSPETTALIVESEEILLSCSTNKIQPQDEEENHFRFEEEESVEKQKTPPPKPTRTTQTTPATSRKLLQAQVDQQKKYQDRSIKLLQEQNLLIEKQNKILKTRAEETKKIRRLKEEELRIFKRRAEWEEKENYENRKLKVAELELKKRKLELKEQELGNQRD